MATQKPYHANIVAESIYAQTDHDGYTTYILKEIVDHKSDDSAVKVQDAYYVNKATRKKRLKLMTKGRQL